MIMFRFLPTAGLAFMVAGGALAQTPPAGMTRQQYQDAGRGRMLERDADGDGRISAAEFAAGQHGRGGEGGNGGGEGRRHGGGGGGERMFQRFDANGDGYLDKAEIDAMLRQRFERMDANHDGIVTPEEREASRGAGRMRPDR
jgi:hypothetical protein